MRDVNACSSQPYSDPPKAARGPLEDLERALARRVMIDQFSSLSQMFAYAVTLYVSCD